MVDVQNIREAWDCSENWDEYVAMLQELYGDDWEQWFRLTHRDTVYGLEAWTAQ